MANEKHLEILKSGVEVWNKWREENLNIIPDLIDANLSGANLKNTDMRGVILRNANLRNSDLKNASLIDADMGNINLENADMMGVNLRSANMGRAKMVGANMAGVEMIGTYLKDANLTCVNLRSASLINAYIVDAYLIGADLEGANLEEANLRGADLKSANLTDANLTVANLVQTNFTNAIITGVSLYGTARDNWIIDGVKCDYVFFPKRTPSNRNFRSGEFEELYKCLPTFEYYFKHGFTALDAVVMARIVEAINEQHPELKLDLVAFDKRGEPHATFTVLYQDHVEVAKAQVATIYERRIIELEAQKDQLMDVIKMLGSGGVMLQPVAGGITIKSVLSPVLTQRIVEFLGTLPGLEKEDARRAWLYSAGLDTSLQQQIQISGSSIQFFQLLVQTVVGYGRLNDGRLAIEAILNAAKGMVGQDRQAYCTTLIQEIHDAFNERI